MAIKRGVKFEWTKNDITYYGHSSFTGADESQIDTLIEEYLVIEKEKDRNATFVQSWKLETEEV
jgi:hypothetical protein